MIAMVFTSKPSQGFQNKACEGSSPSTPGHNEAHQIISTYVFFLQAYNATSGLAALRSLSLVIVSGHV